MRHRSKYVDVPVGDSRAFVFGTDGEVHLHRARTLREFVSGLEGRRDIDGHLRRGDFSKWIADVFGDQPLATELQELEARHRLTPTPATRTAIIHAVRARYDL